MMKFAFSSIACPTWDFETIAGRAEEYGYGGVEIRGYVNEPVLTTANLLTIEPAKLKAIFGERGIEIACLSSGISMSGSKSRDEALAGEARRFIDLAGSLGCGLVKIRDTFVKPGQTYAAVGIALGKWLMPLADYATDRNVTLLVENAISFRTAREVWLIIEQTCHPSFACCWDVTTAAMAGETPAVSVPVLNSRIQFVQVQDAKLSPGAAALCKLGEGDVPVKNLLTRLRGIGYRGWVSLQWDKARLPALAEPEVVLPDAVKKLKEWTEPPAPPKPAVKPAAAHKPAAKAPAAAAPA
jgi:sugar phosphate isomerase/epimerase